MEKAQLRRYYLSVRKKISTSDHLEKSAKIAQHVKAQPLFKSSGTIMIYCSIGSEVRTDELICAMLSGGKRVAVPCCSAESRLMSAAEIRNPKRDLVCGPYGTVQPPEVSRITVSLTEIEYVVCPGVAFDYNGNRLGRGKACYDSFLSLLKGKIPIVGLAFECQISSENLPADSHDIAMDQIITENGPLLENPPPFSRVSVLGNHRA
ncbi:MAG: 5-formyltetrahydrofolate cyclo-ligase [Chitinispirillaceae bacterium]